MRKRQEVKTYIGKIFHRNITQKLMQFCTSQQILDTNFKKIIQLHVSASNESVVSITKKLLLCTTPSFKALTIRTF